MNFHYGFKPTALSLHFIPLPLMRATLEVVQTGTKTFYAWCYKEQYGGVMERRYLRVDPDNGQVMRGSVEFPSTSCTVRECRENGWPLPPKPRGTDWHRAALKPEFSPVGTCKDVQIRAFYTTDTNIKYVCRAEINGVYSYADTRDFRYFMCDTICQDSKLVLVDDPPAV